MKYEEFYSLCENRFSCRNFTGEPLPEGALEKILAAARLAPSACNSQPWRVKVVTDPEMKKKTAKALQDGGMNLFCDNAACFLCLYPAVPQLKIKLSDNSKFVKYDIGEFAAYVTLASASLGIGSIILGWVNSEALDEATEYDGDGVCELVIALGMKKSPDVPKKIRKPMDSIVF